MSRHDEKVRDATGGLCPFAQDVSHHGPKVRHTSSVTIARRSSAVSSTRTRACRGSSTPVAGAVPVRESHQAQANGRSDVHPGSTGFETIGGKGRQEEDGEGQ
jgi:hypothetical protein